MKGNQRWRGGRHTYRPPNEPIQTRLYEVANLLGDGSDRVAKAFVRAHHYSASYPSAKRRFGLFRGPELVGVAVFSTPQQKAVLVPFPGNKDEKAELGRFVLLDDVPGNGETWFLARAFELLRRDGFASIVSFSDPVPRPRADGTVVFPGHVGTIYQAFNGHYLGRSKRETKRLFADGTALPGRTLSKLRNNERGQRHVVELLRRHGAPAPTGDVVAWATRWASMADVFEDRPELESQRLRLWSLIADTPNLDWLLLTKRPENVSTMLPANMPRGNVWLGTTAEDQWRADERIPHLLANDAAVRFVSAEPLLERVDLRRFMWPAHARWPSQFKSPEDADAAGVAVTYHRQALVFAPARFIDWVIIGGESGARARPFDLRWARDIVAQCRAAGAACFVKQLGERPQRGGPSDFVHFGRGERTSDKKGGAIDEFPTDLRVREFPTPRAT